MLSAAEARSQGLVPEASEDTLRAFSVSEMKLYKHATTYKWKVDELIATIKLIKSVEFRVDDVNVDLHKRVAAAIAQDYFTSHSMRESDLDGDHPDQAVIAQTEEFRIAQTDSSNRGI